MTLGYLVPAGPQNLGSLASHPQKKSVLFGPGEQLGGGGSGFPEPAERAPETPTRSGPSLGAPQLSLRPCNSPQFPLHPYSALLLRMAREAAEILGARWDKVP